MTRTRQTTPVRSKLLHVKGFTLIEIMIVLVIIGAVLALAVPKLANSRSKSKDDVRRIAVLTKEIHNSAKLENRTYRIAFSMPENKPHSYWIESADAGTVLLSADQQKKLKDADPKKSLIAKDNGFETSKSILKNPVELSKKLFIDDIEYADGKPAVNSGTAYIHFFSQGLVQEAAIHISDHNTLHWTIYIHPLTARATIYEKTVAIKDIERR